MTTAENLLDRLMSHPEPERTAIAIAQLDRVEAFDPHADLSPEAFRDELERRVADARRAPGEGSDWATVRARLERTPPAQERSSSARRPNAT